MTNQLHKLLLLIAATIFTCNAYAYDVEIDGIYYNLNTESLTASVTHGDARRVGDVAIPASITHNDIAYSVTSIEASAFQGNSGLTSIDIPSSVTSIEAYAFSGCKGLTVINVSSDNPAYCSSDGILYDKGKTTLILCPGAKTGSVSIPKGVTSIEASAFSECSGLTEINVSSDNPAYCSSDGILYNKEKTTLILCPGAKTGSVSIPEGVTSIESRAFDGCSGLTSIDIPSGATSIGERAFSGCSGLTSISIPEGVTSIGGSAFYKCSGLTSISLPEGVTSIGSSAFYGCNGLTSISLPSSVTSIGNNAFYACSGLTSISLPSSVTSIGAWAFSYCSGLTSVKIPEGVTRIERMTFYYCTGLTTIEIPKGVTRIEASAFAGCSGLTSIYSFSSEPPYAAGCFDNNHYQSATLYVPQEAIEAYQASLWSKFQNIQGFDPIGNTDPFEAEIDGIYYNLDTESQTASVISGGSNYYTGDVTIPASITHNGITYSVTSIGRSAFANCSGLTSISISEGVTKIGRYAFYGCSGLTSIYSFNPEPPYAAGCFDNNHYQSATLYVPQEAIEAYRAASPWSNFQNIQDPYTYEAEIDGIYYILNTKSLTASVTSGDDFYTGDVTIPASITHNDITYSVTSIGEMTFYDCSDLTSISIPSSVTSIGEYAFSGCFGLTSISIPEGVTSIERWAFDDCYELTSIYSFNHVPPTASSYSFYHDNFENATLYVPTKAIEAYRAADGWSNFINIQGAYTYEAEIDGIYYILNPEILTASVISRDDKYTGDVTIPASITHNGLTYSVTSIGEEAFDDCKELTSVKIPEGVTSIGAWAFSGCTGLTSINIPEGVTSIERSAFSFCLKLTSIDLPSSVTSIGAWAFNYCYKLTSINIPSSVTSIGEYAFCECSGLTSIYSFNPIPPTASADCFNDNHYQSATLYVPQESVEAYQAANVWKNFQNIQGFDTTGIEGIEVENGNRPAAYYDANGRKSATPHHGVNIVRMTDGTTRKVMMK